MKILCVYYSRTGNTEKLMEEIAGELGCEKVRLSDGVDRSGLLGWLRSGMQAMARHVPQVDKPETELPLGEYDLVIIGTPVWAGRCSAPSWRSWRGWAVGAAACWWQRTMGGPSPSTAGRGSGRRQ